MNHIKKITMAGLLLLVINSADARRKKLTEPEPMLIQPNIQAQMIEDAVTGALAINGWVIEGQSTEPKPLQIDAALYVRTHKIKVTITKHDKQLVMSYLDSENMKYKLKKKQAYIHPNYMEWTQQLANQIATNLDMGDDFNLTEQLKSAPKTNNPPPTVALKHYNDFRIEPTTLNTAYQGNKGNLSTVKNLNHNLNLLLEPQLQTWNEPSASNKTLLIKPHIEAVRFIGTAARIWAGSLAGRSWIFVKVDLIDESTGDLVGQPELYRVARLGNGFTGSSRDYKMVEDMAADITQYIQNNYHQAIGGGRVPPTEIIQEVRNAD